MNAPPREAKGKFNRIARTPEWIPFTDIGVLVKAKKISLSEIFKFSYTIREPEIIDTLFEKKLKEEILSVKSVQKQTKAGQRTRIKVCVVVGDSLGHVGIGSKAATDFASALRGAVRKAKCSIQPVNLGYWGNAVGEPHTVQATAHGKSGSVRVKVIPGTKGTGIIAGKPVKKIFEFAGIKDVFTFSSGQTSTTENFAKAVFQAINNSSNFHVPALWEEQEKVESPLLKHSKFLATAERRKKE
ncbi:40S ribosomal protein S2 [Cucumispora dikerogammari]|nr:40S ribosomal protein S2 [Cucumispora dikerogammari]